MDPWRVLDSKYVLKDRWIAVRSDTCETAKGVPVAPYYVFEYPDWAFVAALDDRNRMLFVRLYRHGAQEVCLELPGGVVEPSETPEEAIRRELLEETGYTSDRFMHVGSLTPNAATHRNRIHCFVAHDCHKVAEQGLDDTEEIEHEWMDIAEWLEQVEKGDFFQALHIATIFLALRHAGLLERRA
jgi:8-oxo-dGTP pyrophosphatase MutT (NUDIX family)